MRQFRELNEIMPIKCFANVGLIGDALDAQVKVAFLIIIQNPGSLGIASSVSQTPDICYFHITLQKICNIHVCGKSQYFQNLLPSLGVSP